PPAPCGAPERRAVRDHPAGRRGWLHATLRDPEPGALEGGGRDEPDPVLPQARGAAAPPHRGLARRPGPGPRTQRPVLPERSVPGVPLPVRPAPRLRAGGGARAGGPGGSDPAAPRPLHGRAVRGDLPRLGPAARPGAAPQLGPRGGSYLG